MDNTERVREILSHYRTDPEIVVGAIAALLAHVDDALAVAHGYGSIDGAHHKSWVVDQMVRALTGNLYGEWVRAHKRGDDGPETYGWDEGIAP